MMVSRSGWNRWPGDLGPWYQTDWIPLANGAAVQFTVEPVPGKSRTRAWEVTTLLSPLRTDLPIDDEANPEREAPSLGLFRRLTHAFEAAEASLETMRAVLAPVLPRETVTVPFEGAARLPDGRRYIHASLDSGETVRIDITGKEDEIRWILKQGS